MPAEPGWRAKARSSFGQRRQFIPRWQVGAVVRAKREVITWALEHPGFTVIPDDRRARALATRYGIAVLGSLRIMVLTRQRGFIPRAKPALERLRGAGAWVSDELIDRAIALAGEV